MAVAAALGLSLVAAQTVRRVQDFARRKRGDGPSEALAAEKAAFAETRRARWFGT